MRPIYLTLVATALLSPMSAGADCPTVTTVPRVDAVGRIHLPAVASSVGCVAMTLVPDGDGRYRVEGLAAAQPVGVFSPLLAEAVAAMLAEQRRRQPGASDAEVIAAIAARLGMDIDRRAVPAHIATALVSIEALLGENELAVFWSDPSKGIWVLIDAEIATETAQRRYPDSLYNGIGDAFRHGLWQALSAYHTGEEYAQRFGDAHEQDYPGSPLETEMDLFNNAVGRGIGVAASWVGNIAPQVEWGIATGQFVKIVDGQLVPTNQ